MYSTVNILFLRDPKYDYKYDSDYDYDNDYKYNYDYVYDFDYAYDYDYLIFAPTWGIYFLF